MHKEMKPKKFMAREVILILGFIIAGLIIAYSGDCLNQYYKIHNFPFAFKRSYELPGLGSVIKRALSLVNIPRYSTAFKFGKNFYIWIENFGEFLLLIGYPLYSIFRFISWVIKRIFIRKAV